MMLKKSAVLFGAASAIMAAVPLQAQAAGPTKLTISYAEKTVDFLPLQIARDAGYFKKHGIDATVTYLPAQQGIPALLTNQVQILAIGGADALSAEAQGVKLRLVATLTGIYPFQFWTRPNLTTADSLKGKRVGVASTTGSLFAGTVLALQTLGLKTSDVAITPLGSIVNVNNSLIAGSIDAAASHPPATYKFKQAGLVDIANLAAKRLPAVSAGIWADASFIQKNPKVMQGVVDSVNEALQREASDKAFTEKEITKYLGFKGKDLLDFTYAFYAKNVLPVGPMPQVAQLQGIVEAMEGTNLKIKTINISKMVDQSFENKARK